MSKNSGKKKRNARHRRYVAKQQAKKAEARKAAAASLEASHYADLFGRIVIQRDIARVLAVILAVAEIATLIFWRA